MKPIVFALPLLGLNVRIEPAPARRAAFRAQSVRKPGLTEALPRHLLQDIGLDVSRRD